MKHGSVLVLSIFRIVGIEAGISFVRISRATVGPGTLEHPELAIKKLSSIWRPFIALCVNQPARKGCKRFASVFDKYDYPPGRAFWSAPWS